MIEGKGDFMSEKADVAYIGKGGIHGHCIIRVDLDDMGQPVDWVFVHANEELAKIEGRPLEQLIGHSFHEVFPAGDGKWLQFCYEAAYLGKSVCCDDISENIGLYMHVEAYPTDRVGLCSCIVCDIKESVAAKLRQKAMQQVAENAAVINALSTIYTTIMEADLVGHGYKIIQTNSPMKRVVGGKDQGNFDAVMEDVLKYYMHPDDIDRMRAFIDLSTLSSRMGSETSLVTEYRAPYGKWFESRFIAKQRDEQGRVVSAIYAAKDVTPEKQKELLYRERLKEAAESARHANKAKTDFLLRMSHDIRTPMNGIRGMLDIADHYDGNLEKQRECRKKIRESSNILLELINEVLDMSKLESGEIVLEHVPFDLAHISSEIFTVIEKQAEEQDIEIIEDCQLEYLNLFGSPIHLKRLILNILGNAIKYNRPHGKVYITCRESVIAADVGGEGVVLAEGSVLAEGAEGAGGGDATKILLQTVIRDTGIGMSPEFQKHLFEPFQQENSNARSKYGGTGLGMSIAKSLAEKMGGTITCQSEKNVGTTFTVQIPFEVDSSQHSAAVQEEGETLSIAGQTLILAEDNDLNLEIAKFMLSEAGAKVIEVHDGQEAVDAFASSAPGQVTAILMDLMMPVMDGYEATRRIRTMQRPDAATVPIIAMTANAFVEDRIATKKAGMNAHITKPLNVNSLIRVIAKQINQKDLS